MYDFDIDLKAERRSFRAGRQVFSLVLEKCWWQALESVCPGQDSLKGWILEWIEDARAKGVNRQALIRYRIHQLVLDNCPPAAPDPRREALERIEELRSKRLPWRKVADTLNREEVATSAGRWTEESVKSFYYINRQAG
jgi:predicted DNA-binding ribbon-helix-helix protein